MEWTELLIILLGAFGMIGVLTSAITFYKVWTGRRYKIFLIIITMLLFANIGSVIEATGYALGFEHRNKLLE